MFPNYLEKDRTFLFKRNDNCLDTIPHNLFWEKLFLGSSEESDSPFCYT